MPCQLRVWLRSAGTEGVVRPYDQQVPAPMRGLPTANAAAFPLLVCAGTKGKVGPSDQPVVTQQNGRGLAEDKQKASTVLLGS